MGKIDSKIIQSTTIPYIEITAKPASQLNPWRRLNSWQSKFAGIPYLKNINEHPRNKDGYFHLLAQINFKEIPEIDQGLLQFWIAGDDFYGCNFDGNKCEQKNFRIIYHEDIPKGNLVSNFDYMTEAFVGTPCDGFKNGYKLKFRKKSMPVTINDYRFDSYFKDYDDNFIKNYENNYPSLGHRIGGYPDFAQVDPRDNKSNKNTLLLQIDSDYKNEIGWGDCGCGNFFINADHLRNKNFTDVLYNWDCA